MTRPPSRITTVAYRQPTEKRAKPRGMEILFSGTPVSAYRWTMVDAAIGKVETIPQPPGEPPYVIESWAHVPVVPLTHPAPRTTLVSQVDGKLRTKIKNQRVNLAQTLGEYRSTSVMFGDTGTRVLRAVRAARRLNVHGVLSALVGTDTTRYPTRWRNVARTPTRSLAETNLAFQFGVMPLIYDLDGSIAELIEATQTKPLVARFSASANHVTSRSASANYDAYFRMANASTRRERLKAVAWVEFKRPTLETLTTRLGFRNVASLAWELTPYSVFIDYFINIGDFLQNLDALEGVERIGVSYSQTIELTETSTFSPRQKWYVGGSSSHKNREVSRFIGADISRVELGFTAPKNFTQIMNLLAFARIAVPKAHRKMSSGMQS